MFISPKIEIGEDEEIGKDEVTVQSQWSEAEDDLHPEEDVDESQMSQNMQVFNVVFHRGGEFVRFNDGDTIYKDGVSTIVYGQLIDKWSMVTIHKLVNGWGYIEKTYRMWTKILDIDENVFQIMNNDDAYNFGAYTYGFDGIDVSLPVNEGTIVVGLLTSSKKKKWEDDKYVGDELDNSDPDVSDDDNGPEFDKFRIDQLNNNLKFKWGMQFDSLYDFREEIREWKAKLIAKKMIEGDADKQYANYGDMLLSCKG
ncbi:hypothetical protein KIW84_020772 [Lathyrus oleraceus]|uniref:PB1-like domain-containing protein n=1 Tax=Pisum sativum TaxID=3888 RepID=A0A9D4YBK4_PEA|nr:hypothetical protein KIW84_020772 [Pisum sativum]